MADDVMRNVVSTQLANKIPCGVTAHVIPQPLKPVPAARHCDYGDNEIESYRRRVEPVAYAVVAPRCNE